MRIRFTVGTRIGLGFAILIFLSLLNFILTFKTVTESSSINKEITEVYNPSVDKLEALNLMIVRSKLLITNWLSQQKQNQSSKKLLPKLIYEDYQELRTELKTLSENWDEQEQQQLDELFKMIDQLFLSHEQVMNMLKTFADYEDGLTKFMAEEIVNDGMIETQTTVVLDLVEELSMRQLVQTEEVSKDMLESFQFLNFIISSTGIGLIIIGIFVAIFTVRSIVAPVHTLKNMLNSLGKGILPQEKIPPRDDEIGEMCVAMNQLVDGLKETVEFSRQVGIGNFHAPYKPLSDKDTLGHALLQMRDELYELKEHLEEKVKDRTEEVVKQKEEIESQSKEIEAKNLKLEELYVKVTDSIHYAKRIQQSILPPSTLMRKHLKESFILYKPKDIVSGDFYWMDAFQDKIMIAAVDCTGHGVPGAFMSIVGYNNLNMAVNVTKGENAAMVLDQLNESVTSTLRQTHDGTTAKDGMDLALCSFDLKKNRLDFAGAFNPLYRIRNNELEIVKGNKFPIGIHILQEEKEEFTNHRLDVKSGDVYYIFSDGYADQFGGPKGKKFMYRRFRNLLLDIHKKDMEEQRKILDETIEKWMSDTNQEQLDDILVIGIRIPA
ncbi:SpoIIE family protein phosphatase [Hyphobacterium sp. CCMP332]|nr:SpoIIE family protein phosphatase [Hyphobacterium sp. CCMP332]